ncbi:MAG: LptF/LptG family permease [Planctomycetota bacterium]|jgi:lipopolysaccharide export system permease protein|nr:LptF/LptG family permease [Planctomycetota bacterium]
MAKRGNFRAGGTPPDEPAPAGGREAEELGATGFYYVAPADEWEDESARRRRRGFFRLVILPVYIWRELIKGVALSVAVFSLILMAVFAGQVMRDGIGVYTLARILPNFLPLICPFVLPLAIITGVIICYSRLARDNEILAAYAGGVHPLWVVIPALLNSVIAIFITLSLNESALMPAISNIERLVLEDRANILRRMLARPGNITVQTGDEYLAMSKLLPAGPDAGGAILDLTHFTPPGGEAGGIWDPAYPIPSKRITARDHRIQGMADNDNQLTLSMPMTKFIIQDIHAADIDKIFITDGEAGEERIVIGGRPRVTINSNRPSFWPILRLSADRQESEALVQELESAIERLGDLPDERGERIRKRLAELRARVAERTSQINMRLALCFSCLAFAFLGIPLGMRTRGTLVSSFGVGIVVSGLYFLVLKALEHRMGEGLLPYWVIWLPDAAVLGISFFLWLAGSSRD